MFRLNSYAKASFYLLKILFVTLLLQNEVFAFVPEDAQTRFTAISNRLNEQRSHKRFSLKLQETGEIASTFVFDQSHGLVRVSNFPMKVCEIHINYAIFDKYELSDDALAVVIGHEMGHCELEKSNLGFSPLNYSEKNWVKEYSADNYGIKLSNAIGFDGVKGFEELSKVIEIRESTTHPSMAQRVKALKTGEVYIRSSIKVRE